MSQGFVTLMLSADGERVVTTGLAADTTIHDARTLRPLTRWPVRAEQAALSRDGRTLLAGGADGSVRFVDLATGDVTPGAGHHAARVERAVFSPDGRQAVTAGADGRMFVWDVERTSVGETLEGHAGKITGLTISRDGSTLYTSAYDGKVLVWDLGGAARLGRTFASDSDVNVPRYALSPDGRDLAIGGLDGTITIIDARTLKTRSSFPVVGEGAVRGMGYVPGGKLLVVGGDDGFLALVDPRRSGSSSACPASATPSTRPPSAPTAGSWRRSATTGSCSTRCRRAGPSAVRTSARPRSRTCRSAPTAARWR